MPKGIKNLGDKGLVILAPENTIGNMIGVTPNKEINTYLKNGILSAPKKKLAKPKGSDNNLSIKHSNGKS